MIEFIGNIRNWEVDNSPIPKTIDIYFKEGKVELISGYLISINCGHGTLPDGEMIDNYAEKIVISEITHVKMRKEGEDE